MRRTSQGQGSRPEPFWPRLAFVFAAATVVVSPLVVLPGLDDAFALPKLMLAEVLALATLLCLAPGLATSDGLTTTRLLSPRAIRAVLPFLLVATVGLAATRHPAHTTAALADLWIGAAFLVACAIGFPVRRLRRLVELAALPAALLAVLGILQFHGLMELFQSGAGGDPERLGVTSLAGATGDLAAYLAFACVVAQLAVARGRHRLMWLAVAVLCLYGVAVTQTLTAVIALTLASALLWVVALPGLRAVLAPAALIVCLLVSLALISPLRQRALHATQEGARGRVNAMLVGRLDAWRAAELMLQEHPLTGVGLGVYRAELVPTKLELLEEGRELYQGHRYGTFRHAHNEYLQVAAELGWPGVATLLWALAHLGIAVFRGRRESPGTLGLTLGGVTLLAVLAVAHFPFHLALTAYPALVFLAWIFAQEAES